jgi:hypothetical protein
MNAQVVYDREQHLVNVTTDDAHGLTASLHFSEDEFMDEVFPAMMQAYQQLEELAAASNLN